MEIAEKISKLPSSIKKFLEAEMYDETEIRRIEVHKSAITITLSQYCEVEEISLFVEAGGYKFFASTSGVLILKFRR